MTEDINHQRTIYFDMDGVLADFDQGFYTISGGKHPPVNDHNDEEMWSIIEKYGKSRFFSELPLMDGALEMWKFARDNFLSVKILSATGKSDAKDGQNTQGKLMWLRHNLPDLRQDDIILVPNKHRKRHYCKLGDIIIDDNEVVVDEWKKKGGIPIFHKSATETMLILKQYV